MLSCTCEVPNQTCFFCTPLNSSCLILPSAEFPSRLQVHCNNKHDLHDCIHRNKLKRINEPGKLNLPLPEDWISIRETTQWAWKLDEQKISPLMKFKGSLQHLTRFPWWRNTLWWEGEIMRTWMPERYDVIGMGIFNQNTLLFNFRSCRLTVPVISFDWHRSKQAECVDYFPLIREWWSVGIMNMIS